MANFIVYDLIFLVVFSLLITLLLYKNRKSLKREMKVMFLYRAQWGVNAIKYVGSYKRTLKALKYPIIVSGFVLMAGILYLIGNAVYVYIRYPTLATSVTKAPPIAPVIPYFPQLFGLESFFPPFYFTYFIVALAIVGFVHEFSHGIFMVLNKVRIKSTGIVFLGPILGAFVEQNEKDMQKISKSNQMNILAAGVFANLITGLVFFFLWMAVFYGAFMAGGVAFTDYTQGVIHVNDISMIGNVTVKNANSINVHNVLDTNELDKDFVLKTDDDDINFTKVTARGIDYYITSKSLKEQLNERDELVLYYDLPAINVGLKGTIIEIDGEKISGYGELTEKLTEFKPGDKITIKTDFEGEIEEYNIILGEVPETDRALIGISNSREIRGNIADSIALFKEPFTVYEQKNEFLVFIYYLLFWIVIINFLVALFNMLPISILDGGRFFYLSIWGLTGNEDHAKKFYKWMGIIILAGFILMLAGWAFGLSG